MKYSIVLFSLIMALFVACKEEKASITSSNNEEVVLDFEDLNKLEWIIGEWVNETDKEYTRETWKRINDSTLTGFSYSTVAQDTVFAETLVLQQKKEVVSLKVVAYGQNDNEAVVFKMVSSDSNKYIFENLAHDFPQQIVYTQPSKDVIHAWVEGNIDGELKKIDFHFTRN